MGIEDLAKQIETAIAERSAVSSGIETLFLCVAHDDHNPSARWNTEKRAWFCDVCQTGGSANDLARRLGIETAATEGKSDGLTVEQYCEAKGLDPEFIATLGVATFSRESRPAVRIPYRDANGTLVATRQRIALSGDRFRWKKGDKPTLYGLDRLDTARSAGYALLVEGESDAHTCWQHQVPAVGIPGASNWSETFAPYLDGVTRIYVVVEPDTGGSTLLKALSSSSIRERLHLVRLDGMKDVNELHRAEPNEFVERLQRSLDAAPRWEDELTLQRREEATALWPQVQQLACEPALIERLEDAVRDRGYAGDPAPVVLVYLALTSRFLNRPMNVVISSPSATGKSATVEAALAFVPETAYTKLSASSEKAFIYMPVEFEHRFLIFAEGDSIPRTGPAASAFRAVAADNEMRYVVTERSGPNEQHTTRSVEKRGPTGIITTSTVALETQIATRMLEVTLPDDPERTYSIMMAQAQLAMGAQSASVDLADFIALQRWLELAGERRVIVPFADRIPPLMGAAPTRMNRDFRQLLTCIAASAFLHQMQRERTADGSIVAQRADYELAYRLLLPSFGTVMTEGVTPEIREIVEALPLLGPATVTQLAEKRGLSKSTVSGRVSAALELGWMVNTETVRGRPFRLERGEPLPSARGALPDAACVFGTCDCSADEHARKRAKPEGFLFFPPTEMPEEPETVPLDDDLGW